MMQLNKFDALYTLYFVHYQYPSNTIHMANLTPDRWNNIQILKMYN